MNVHAVLRRVFVVLGCFATFGACSRDAILRNIPPFVPIAAACIGPDGHTRCGSVPRWNKTRANTGGLLGATSGGDRAAAIPSSWTVPDWYYDPTNTTGCASDNNTCTQGTCGGNFQGPCITHDEVVARWGTNSPRLQQVTTHTVLGAMPSTDPWYSGSHVEGSGLYEQILCPIVGAPLWTGTINAVTAKNKTTDQRLVVGITSTGGSVALGQLVYNQTHTSTAWLVLNPGMGLWTPTQPITGCTNGSVTCAPSEVDTWTVGDTIVGVVPPSVYLVEALPTNLGNTDYARSGRASLFVHGCGIQSNIGVFTSNPLVILSDSQVIVASQSTPQASSTSGPGGAYFVGDYMTYYRGPGFSMYAGYAGANPAGFTWASGGNVDGDAWFAEPLFFQAGAAAILGSIYIGDYVAIIGGVAALKTSLWGPGFFQVQAGAFLQYPSGVGGAAAAFLQAGAIYLNDTTTACSSTGGATPVTACGISITPGHLDASVGPAGFGGNAFAMGGGQISNVGQDL